MKNHITQQELKPDSPLPLAIAVHEGVIVGTDAADVRTSTAKATGDRANDPIIPFDCLANSARVAEINQPA